MAYLFGVPQARWAFFCLAIFPLAKAFNHLDPTRIQREMRFGPSVMVDVCTSVFVTIALVPLAFWLKNYAVMLWALVLQAVASTVATHFAAERKYAWAWEKRYVKEIFSFGWPLLINGLLLYGIFEGDRLVIGSAKRLFPHSHFTLTDLGIYSVAFALTMAPTSLVANVSTSLFLPVLSRVQNDARRFDEQYLLSSQVSALVAMTITIPFIVCGGWVVTLLYGAKYAAAANIIGWLAAMWGIRTFRVAPTVAAIAKGDTRNAMFANVVRSLAFVGMLIVAMVGGPLAWISICGFCGEVLAMIATVWRLEVRQGVGAMICLKPFMAFIAGAALAGLTMHAGVSRLGPVYLFCVAAILVVAMILAMVAVFPNLRDEVALLLRSSGRWLITQKVAEGSNG
jgi:O-antigen/teichoic acid export membrane protein